MLATHQQKGGPPKDKFGNLLDTSKQCGYCQKVKKWRGIGHTESECKTKQQERGGQESQGQGPKSGQVKAAYEEDDFEIQSQLGGVKIGTIRVGKLKRQNSGWYEFDTGAQAHTTNEKWRLNNIQPGRNCKSTVFYRTPAPIIVYYFPYITCLLYLLFLIKHVRTSG